MREGQLIRVAEDGEVPIFQISCSSDQPRLHCTFPCGLRHSSSPAIFISLPPECYLHLHFNLLSSMLIARVPSQGKVSLELFMYSVHTHSLFRSYRIDIILYRFIVMKALTSREFCRRSSSTILF